MAEVVRTSPAETVRPGPEPMRPGVDGSRSGVDGIRSTASSPSSGEAMSRSDCGKRATLTQAGNKTTPLDHTAQNL